MTDCDSSRNNILLAQYPPARITAASRPTQDPVFYYKYNIIVLSVGGNLFRIPASFLAPDPGIQDYELKSYMKSAFDLSTNSSSNAGFNDKDPIVLPPNISVETVRDLLTVSSGGMRLIISNLVCKAYDCPDESKDLSDHTIIAICADLYTEKDLLVNTPDMFGFIFSVVLSLGHRSRVWTRLTREQRRVLYAGNSTLVQLCDHTDLGINWLLEPSEILEIFKDCPNCRNPSNINKWWSDTFGRCQGLNSPIPSEDIRYIVRLPEYRYSISWASKSQPWLPCGSKCIHTLRTYIDEHMEALYCALAKKYRYLEE
ncbi:polyadenylate-binding protein, cytoplasmic and nuclear [Rhizoctonia solani]|uniref:Polyadenylate-binding protein, cytoplasmic and nuclear n=1 Tax=Rhizoctonia solani TaxID=456999 RepID=A0A8H8SZV5_9AGAM|nr:polyadenylate-binding protein, cytoplasmic and nuclear [Rhizoctonia solani]QRW24716.1 polyadenylate-binding protein, cytoplasmic and nuclear [Rhizoctonia solani]